MAAIAADEPARQVGWITAATLAVAAPSLLAYNLPPSATFLNQAAALLGWAGWLAMLAVVLPAGAWRHAPAGLKALLAALALLALAALASSFWAGLPGTLSSSALGLIAAAALVALVACAVQRSGLGPAAIEAFCIALVAAGVLSSLIAIVQVFFPELTSASWIAPSSLGDRAVGNLRQSNHLSSLLLWSAIAVVWIGDGGRLPRPATAALLVLMLFGVVLSASRTGMLGSVVLLLWGLLDRSLARRSRVLLWLAPLIFALLWFGATEWAHSQEQVFGGEAQLHKSDISSSRFGIWKNTLSLIAAHPWAGVGFGEFNLAWSLTPFPDRPVAFFDHTHNLPLQFAVELGLPLATLVLALLAWALREAWCRARDAQGAQAPALRAALVMVLMIALHSLLEYPLWYAYFLLPTAFAFGLCLGGTPDAAPAPAVPVRRVGPLLIATLLLTIGSLVSVLDYFRVVAIFSPPEGAASLKQRVISGRGSIFFGHHADYAAATLAEHPSTVLPAFERASHYLLDARLMMAWATAFHEIGDDERARNLAQRLREFRNEQSEEFFAPCKAAPADAAELPFQCTPPKQALDYRSFR